MPSDPSVPPRFTRRSLSFIVRLWSLPPDPAGESSWRGQIEHVASGKIATFQIPASLLALVAAQVGALDTLVAVEGPVPFPGAELTADLTEEGD